MTLLASLGDWVTVCKTVVINHAIESRYYIVWKRILLIGHRVATSKYGNQVTANVLYQLIRRAHERAKDDFSDGEIKSSLEDWYSKLKK